jgi:hypothetical protein
VFPDGKVAVLWDYEDLGESDYDEGDLDEYNYTTCWFEGPILYPLHSGMNHAPIIQEWYIEDLTWDRTLGKDSSDRVLQPVSDEFILRFYAYVQDPDGSHEDHYLNGYQIVPKLLLTNLDTPNASLEPIDMKYTGGNYGPGPDGYDEYFVDILGTGYYAYHYENRSDLVKFGFGPGAWTFSFQVTDNESLTTIELSEKKIWHIGSFEKMRNGIFYGRPTGSGVGGIVGAIITTVIYMAMGFMAASSNTYVQTAAQLISIGMLLLDMGFNIYSLVRFAFETEDTGSLLGLGLNLALKSCGFLISLLLSKTSGGSFNFNFLGRISVILTGFTLFNLFNDFFSHSYTIDENGLFTLEQDQSHPTADNLLGGYPAQFLAFFTSIVGLTFSLFVASGYAKFGNGKDVVSKIIVFHTILSLAVSILSIFVFLDKTGYFHVAKDIIYSNLYGS